MKNREIERRFLLPPCKAKRLLKRLNLPYDKFPLTQFYLPSDEGSLRYRKVGKHYIRTFKKGEGMVRTEIEEEVSEAEFRNAYSKHVGVPVKKVRYRFRLKGRLYELDEFKGPLKGLVMMEAEFDDPDEAERFALPGTLKTLVLDEVTPNRDFTNYALAIRGLPTCPRPLGDLLEAARMACKADPYNASVRLQFHPFEESLRLLQSALYALLQVLRANREAILSGDPDPERLHQLRVALRKIRSLLAFCAEGLGEEPAASLRRRLGALMRATNDARDLDASLLWLDHCERKPFPKLLRGTLDALRKKIVGQKEEAYGALKETLRSRRFEEALEALEDFSTEEPLIRNHARQPALFCAKSLLLSQVRRLVNRSKKLHRDSPPEAYHKVRIEAKKLRYMLELFASILESAAYGKALKKVKKIQEILGEHQDLTVQIAYLKSLKKRHKTKDPEIEAIEDLLRLLRSRARKRRKSFRKKTRRIEKTEAALKRAVCRI